MEHKALPLAEFKIDAGTGEFSGYGSTFGNADAGGDIVVRGAFAKAIPDFLRDGFISWSHDWGVPVAMPTKAHEDSHGLFLAGVFHSTPEAQTARTIAAERLAAGKRMGLSIGYGIEEEEASPKGRLLKVIYPLYEVGFVTVPMNREANLSAVKGEITPPELRGLDPDAGASLADAVTRFLGDADALSARFDAMTDQRAKAGRLLSAANRTRLAEIRGAIDAILVETDPAKSARSLAALVEEARFLGVPL